MKKSLKHDDDDVKRAVAGHFEGKHSNYFSKAWVCTLNVTKNASKWKKN